ncbi:hypothetical protein P7K49_014966, partial [Saguinus oedipus]
RRGERRGQAEPQPEAPPHEQAGTPGVLGPRMPELWLAPDLPLPGPCAPRLTRRSAASAKAGPVAFRSATW